MGRRLAPLLVAMGLLVPAALGPSAAAGLAGAGGPNAWAPTGSLITARSLHTATLLPNGAVLVAGGRGAGGTALASAELYDPGTERWAATGAMSTARFGHTATLLPDGSVLVAGGTGPSGAALASAERYDPSTGRWVATGSMGDGHTGHTAILLPDGTVLVAGGCCDRTGRTMASAELYDPRTGAWAATAPMHHPRSGHTATLLPGGQVLVMGGDPAGSAELYDPRVRRWTLTGGMRAALRGFTATLLPNGTVLAAGACYRSTDRPCAEIFDPRTGRWTTTGRMLAYREDPAATLLPDGTVLVVGGLTQGSSAEVYDPRTGHWSPTGLLPSPHEQAVATLLRTGQVVVTGGPWEGSSAEADVYTPGATSYVRLSTDRVAFGPQPQLLGTSSLAQSVVVTDVGRLPLTVRGVAVGGAARGDYTVTTTCLATPIAVGRACRIAVRFGPTGAGDRVALLLIADDAPDSPHTVALEGVGRPAHPLADGWTPAGSLSVGRVGHTATLLRDGEVLVAGGCCDRTGRAVAGAELYDPRTGRWRPTGSMREGRAFHTATLLPGGTVLVAGGAHDGGGCCATTRSAELYDPRTGRWTGTGSLATPRAFHVATVLLGGTVLVAGGCCDTHGIDSPDLDYCGHVGCGPLASAEVYDPRTGRWATTRPMHAYRLGHTATRLPDGTVLVAGGSGETSAEVYAPRTGRWSPTGAMVAGRSYHTATLLRDGEVLVAGGCCVPSADISRQVAALASAEVYAPRTGRWRATAAMADARAQHTATILPDGEVLVTGGVTATGYTSGMAPAPPTLGSTELYRPATGTWAATGRLVTPRSAHTATLLPDGTVLVAGGELGPGVDPGSGGVPLPTAGGQLLASAEVYTRRGGSVAHTAHSLAGDRPVRRRDRRGTDHASGG